MPYFSLILPIYNVEKYLARCIDTLLDEVYKDYEMILVDDGSTDKCSEICDRYSELYSFIKVIHKENGGLSSARDAGLEIASGKYIFWIDSDDYIKKGALTVLYEATKNSDYDIVKFNYVTNPEGKVSISSLKAGEYSEGYITETIVPMGLEKTSTINFSIWSHIYRREFIKENDLKFVSERIIGSEDYLYNFESYSSAKSMLVLEDVLYVYDSREGSLSKRFKKNQSEQYRQLYIEMLKFAKAHSIYKKYAENLAFSYIDKCFCICMRNECYLNQDHTLMDAHRNCKKLLKTSEFKEALKKYPLRRVSFGEKKNYYLMKYKMIWLIMFMHLRGINSKKYYG